MAQCRVTAGQDAAFARRLLWRRIISGFFTALAHHRRAAWTAPSRPRPRTVVRCPTSSAIWANHIRLRPARRCTVNAPTTTTFGGGGRASFIYQANEPSTTAKLAKTELCKKRGDLAALRRWQG